MDDFVEPGAQRLAARGHFVHAFDDEEQHKGKQCRCPQERRPPRVMGSKPQVLEYTIHGHGNHSCSWAAPLPDEGSEPVAEVYMLVIGIVSSYKAWGSTHSTLALSLIMV